jgi:uncharacterized membrane protein YraQ (UPF0718 family)
MIKGAIARMRNIRTSATVKFLVVVLGIYIVISFFDTGLAVKAAIDTGETLVKIVPVLILVFGVIYFINRYLNTSKLQKHVGGEFGIRGWLYAIIAGILVSGPPYVLYPLFGDLQKKGMRNALLAVILYNRNVKIPFVPVMIYYFGTAFTIIVSVYIILFSIANGLLVEALTNKKEL